MNESEKKLQQEILADARRKADRIIKRAERDIAKSLEEAHEELDEIRREDLAAAEHTASDARRRILAGIDQKIKQHWLRRREEALDKVLKDTLGELESGDGLDRTRSLRLLIAEAAAAVGPGDSIIFIKPDDRRLLTEKLLAQIAESLDSGDSGEYAFSVETDNSINGGVIVEDSKKRRRYDNTFRTRLQRMKRSLRADICARLDVTLDNSASTVDSKDV